LWLQAWKIFVESLNRGIVESEVTHADSSLKKKNREPLRRAEPIRVMRLAFIFSFATSQGGVKGTKFSVQFVAAAWRFLRQVERCLMIQSVSACSKPMSRPAFSDSIHLCRKFPRARPETRGRAKSSSANRSPTMNLLQRST
jgi:hypothetical protein